MFSYMILKFGNNRIAGSFENPNAAFFEQVIQDALKGKKALEHLIFISLHRLAKAHHISDKNNNNYASDLIGTRLTTQIELPA